MALNLFSLAAALIAVQAADQPQQVFGYADYPPEALRNGMEGVVVADLTISPEGRVSACKIVKSSGYSALDDGTCSLFLRRARFKPALDANGRPVEDHFRTPPITWKLNN